MALRGSLDEMGLGDLFQLLALGRKQGRLTVSSSGRLGVVVFAAGAVADAGVLDAPPRVSRRAAWADRRGALAVAGAEVAGHTEGEMARRLLAHAPDRASGIRAAAAACVDEAVWELLGWVEGRFTFEAGVAAVGDGGGAPRAVEGLLLEAARRADEWPRLCRVLPALTARLVPVGPAPGSEETTGDVGRLWELLDGRRSVDDLVATTGLAPFAVVEQVAAWVVAGRVTVQSPAAAGRAMAAHATPAERFRDAVAALRLGRWEAAAEALQPLAEEAAPAAVHHNLALALEQLGRLEEAQLQAAAARERAGGQDPRLVVSEALLAVQQGDGAHADRLLGMAPVPDPCPAVWYQARGVAALLVGEGARACSTLEAGVVAYPGDVPLLVNLGVARLAVGETLEAVRVLQQAVRAAPALPAAHKALGDALYQGRQFDEALRAYQAVVALAPTHGPDVHGRIGDIHFRRGEVSEARAAWARALAINPAHRLAPTTGQEVAA
jgi:tetratricopeptide (TPR) repeat protein